jgi:predicted lipoprotein with Yx(FWY)xxD motif
VTLRRRPPAWGRPGVMLTASVLAFAGLLAGCSSSATTAHTDGHGPKITVQARTIAGVGPVLVTAKSYALYMFQPDNQRSVTCTGACAGTWPPVKVPDGGSYAAGPGVKDALLGTDPDPEGGTVLTYNGWPLYTYTGDTQPAQATGQAIDLNGGEWYVLRPSGKPLIPVP